MGGGTTPLPALHHTTHEAGGTDAIKLDDLAAPDDNTDLNASTSAHGLLRKLSGTATEFLDGSGAWSTPAGGGGGAPAAHHTTHETGGSDAIAALSAAVLTSGTVPDARFPATLPVASGVNLTTLNASNLASGTVPDARFPATLPAASGVNLTALNASNLGSGTVPDARFPATLPAASGANLTNLNASNLTSGTVPDARFPATLPAASGANLTNLNASNLSSGTVPAARLPARTGVIGIIIDGAGSAITTGVKGFIEVPFACTITGATVLSTDASATTGSIVVDVWKDTYTNYPPTVTDTITASAKPTLSGTNKSKDTTLTGWTTSITAGDILGFKVDSATTVTRVLVSLTVTV